MGPRFPQSFRRPTYFRGSDKIGLGGLVIDVTDRRQMGNELRENIEVLKTFINASPKRPRLLVD